MVVVTAFNNPQAEPVTPSSISDASIAVGVLIGLFSTCVQSYGLTLQRKSHLEEERREGQLVEMQHLMSEDAECKEFIRRPSYRQPKWLIGFTLFILANTIGSVVQITTLPLPVLSTLQASGQVFNTACASLMLNEPFTRFSLIGTALVAAGALLIGLFGAVAEPSHDLDQLLVLFRQPPFCTLMATTLFIAAVILATIAYQERNLKQKTHKARLLLGLGYGCVSGIFSAHTLLLAKSAVELLVRALSSQGNQFNRWQSWAIVLSLVTFALWQLRLLSRGLKLCSTSVLYPFMFCIYNIVAILDGLIYFQQTSRLSVLHACMIVLGTVVLLGGVFVLSWRLGPETSTGCKDAYASTVAVAGLLTRVQAPHGPLTPGLGLINMQDDVDEAYHSHCHHPSPDNLTYDEDDQDFSYPQHRPEMWDSLGHESTPLLSRPVSGQSSCDKYGKRSSSLTLLRPPKTRHTTSYTSPRELTDIWDELHNDGNARVMTNNTSSITMSNHSNPASPATQPPNPLGRLRPLPHKRRHRPTLSSLSIISGPIINTLSTPTQSATVKTLVDRIAWPIWASMENGTQSAGPTVNSTRVAETNDGEDEDYGEDNQGTVRRHRHVSPLDPGSPADANPLDAGDANGNGGWFSRFRRRRR